MGFVRKSTRFIQHGFNHIVCALLDLLDLGRCSEVNVIGRGGSWPSRCSLRKGGGGGKTSRRSLIEMTKID